MTLRTPELPTEKADAMNAFFAVPTVFAALGCIALALASPLAQSF